MHVCVCRRRTCKGKSQTGNGKPVSRQNLKDVERMKQWWEEEEGAAQQVSDDDDRAYYKEQVNSP